MLNAEWPLFGFGLFPFDTSSLSRPAVLPFSKSCLSLSALVSSSNLSFCKSLAFSKPGFVSAKAKRAKRTPSPPSTFWGGLPESRCIEICRNLVGAVAGCGFSFLETKEPFAYLAIYHLRTFAFLTASSTTRTKTRLLLYAFPTFPSDSVF